MTVRSDWKDSGPNRRIIIFVAILLVLAASKPAAFAADPANGLNPKVPSDLWDAFQEARYARFTILGEIK